MAQPTTNPPSPPRMKTIGLIGGMSTASTLLYYQHLYTLTSARLGGLHSPNLLIRSLDFAPIAALQAQGKWDEAAAVLNTAALQLELAGADFIVLATNTMHKVAEGMMKGVKVGLIHIADATARAILGYGQEGNGRKLRKPGLIATAFTMEQDFYVGRLAENGLQAVVPGKEDRAEVHRIIYDELCKRVVKDESRATYVAIAQRLVEEQGADCLILGCTEVCMLLSQANVSVPVFDTTMIHCEEAVRWMLENRPE